MLSACGPAIHFQDSPGSRGLWGTPVVMNPSKCRAQLDLYYTYIVMQQI